MRFFFHVRVDGRRHHDPEGEAFDSLPQARAEAIASARCVLVDLIRDGRLVDPGDSIEVRDEEGALLLDVPLLSVVLRSSGGGSEQLGAHADGTTSQVQVRSKTRDVAKALLSMCLDVTRTSSGNVQLMDWQTGTLSICAHQGHSPEFLKFFETVNETDGSACSQALRSRKTCVVEDVSVDAGMQDCAHVLRRDGLKAVQSTPLLSSDGVFVGVVSTHFAERRRPSDAQLREVAAAARRAADAIVGLCPDAAVQP